MFGLDRWLLAKTSCTCLHMLAHACTCLQKYCTKLNISTAICNTSFIMRRGFDIWNTIANSIQCWTGRWDAQAMPILKLQINSTCQIFDQGVSFEVKRKPSFFHVSCCLFAMPVTNFASKNNEQRETTQKIMPFCLKIHFEINQTTTQNQPRNCLKSDQAKNAKTLKNHWFFNVFWGFGGSKMEQKSIKIGF